MASWDDEIKAAYAEYGWTPDAGGASYWSGNQNLDLLKSTLASDAAKVGANKVTTATTSGYTAPTNVSDLVSSTYKDVWGAAGDKSGVDWWTNYASTSGDADWQKTLTDMLKGSSGAKSVQDSKYAQNLLGWSGNSFDSSLLNQDQRSKIITDAYERFGNVRPGEDDFATWVSKFDQNFGDFTFEDDWANTYANPEGRANYMALRGDQDAYDMFMELQDAMSGMMGQGGGGGSAGGGGLSDYTNPYLQAVLNPAIRELSDATTKQRNRLGSAAFGAGAYGDARHGVESGALTDDLLKNVGDLSSSVHAQGYESAMGWKNTDIDRQMQMALANAGLESQWFNDQLNGATTGSNIANNATGLGFQYADMLSGIDSYDRDWLQQQLNADFEDFWGRENWDASQLSNFLSVISGVPGQSSSTTSSPNNMWASILGSVASDPGLGKTLSKLFK